MSGYLLNAWLRLGPARHFGALLVVGVAGSATAFATGECTEAPVGTAAVHAQGDCYVQFRFRFCAPGENCVNDSANFTGCAVEMPYGPPNCASANNVPSDGYSWDSATGQYCRTWHTSYTSCKVGAQTVCHTATASNAAGSTTVSICAVVNCASPPTPPCDPE